MPFITRLRVLLSVLALLSGVNMHLASPVYASMTAITVGALTLTSTFNSIGVELKFTDDGNANATASLQFKKTSDSTWREGLPLWRTDNGSIDPGPAFYGSALLLDPATTYQVRVTVSDIDGGSRIVEGTVNTRADNILAASALVPTHYVRTNGDDSHA